MAVSSLGRNIASINAQRHLGRATDELARTAEALSSGQRINRASDDAAGLAIAQQLNASSRVFSQGVRNLNDGISLVSIASGALQELEKITERLSELATQSANGVYSQKQRLALDKEAQELAREFNRIARSTEFNGRKLFDADFGDLQLQGGFGTSGTITSGLGGGIGDGTFSKVTTYATGGRPYVVTTADLNNDGNLDIVSANPTHNNLTVAMGRGDGTISSLRTISSTDPYTVALRDFDNDGKIDIATASYTASTLTLFRGQGDGSFASGITYSTGTNPQFLTSGDLNNDGIADVITSDRTTSTLSIFYGTSGNGLSVGSRLNLAGVPNGLVIQDLNNDGNQDLAVTNAGTAAVDVYMGRGGGSFATAVSYTTGGAQPWNLTLSDMNNDGKSDMVVALGAGAANLSIRFGNGDGTFGARMTYSTGYESFTVEAKDFNGDGNLDLLTSHQLSPSAGIRIGNGDGTFKAIVTLPLASTANSATAADLNNDNVLDVIGGEFVNASVAIFLGNRADGVGALQSFSLSTLLGAKDAIPYFNKIRDYLSQQLSEIGAFQSRLSYGLNTLGATITTYAKAESGIRDADIAQESSNYVRLQILQNSASAILAQANGQPKINLLLLNSI